MLMWTTAAKKQQVEQLSEALAKEERRKQILSKEKGRERRRLASQVCACVHPAPPSLSLSLPSRLFCYFSTNLPVCLPLRRFHGDWFERLG